MSLTTHLHPVQMLRMNIVVPSFPHTPSWKAQEHNIAFIEEEEEEEQQQQQLLLLLLFLLFYFCS
jgi:hypothetical protein